MRFLRTIAYACLFLLFSQILFAQENEIKKSTQALKSDELYRIFLKNNSNPQKQLLENTQSEEFPYNIIINNEVAEQDTNEIKLTIVFPQEIVIDYIPQILSLIEFIKENNVTYSVEILFSANDIIDSEKDYTKNSFAGTTTYIQNLTDTSKTATILISPETTNSITTNISLLEDYVKFSPTGMDANNTNELVEFGFFSAIINSMAKADVSYFIEGVLLSLHRLNLIKGDLQVGKWLSNDIPAVAVYINKTNNHKIFAMLESLLTEFNANVFKNTDLNYGYLEIFSVTFFVKEIAYLLMFILCVAITLFIFCHISFINGAHKNIHKQEIARTWYLLPIIVIATTLILFLSQAIVLTMVQSNSSSMLFPFILKIIYTILIALLFSSLRHIFKFPITGFIYAYMLSISAVFNIILFSIVEITLMPLFIIQYLIVQASQKVRKGIVLIICYVLMFLPFVPFIINLAHSNTILQLTNITNAHIAVNILIAFFMLPFQLMTIRIFIRLKLWTTKLKFNLKTMIIRLSIVFFMVILLTIMLIVTKREPIREQNFTQYLNNTGIITTNIHSQEKYGNISHTLSLETNEKIIRYSIELYSNTTLPIYTANYPFEILEKPNTAIFTLDENPPNPFVLEFLSDGKNDIICKITTWIEINSTPQKIYIEKTIEASK